MTLVQVNRPGRLDKGEGGFTLIEMMIVVAIIAIIAAIVYPNYQNYIMKSRRTDAKSLLTQIAAREEQYFMDNKTYTANLTALSYTVDGNGDVTSEQGFYKVQAAATATTFSLIAVPQGTQVNDAKCMNLTLNEQQVKGYTGNGTPVDCW